MIIHLDGRALTVADGATRRGRRRGKRRRHDARVVHGCGACAVCGMGICQECRMTIDGRRRLACRTLCRDGMQVERTR